MKVPNELAEQMVRGNVVLFVGAGLSIGAGLPSWSGLMWRMLEWCESHDIDLGDERGDIEDVLKAGEFLLVAQELRERMGKEGFRQLMVDTFRCPDLRPTSTHELLPDIPFAAVLTTNYDMLLEDTYASRLDAVPRQYTQTDTAELSALAREEEFYILKVHGDIDRIETVVLGRRDYRQAMFANSAYRRTLETIFMTKTVLFLGFGLTDPDLLLLLDEMRTAFKGYSGVHYALMPDVSRLKARRLHLDYGIQVMPYKPSAQDHPEVKAFLSALRDRVQQHPDSGEKQENRSVVHTPRVPPLVSEARRPPAKVLFLYDALSGTGLAHIRCRELLAWLDQEFEVVRKWAIIPEAEFQRIKSDALTAELLSTSELTADRFDLVFIEQGLFLGGFSLVSGETVLFEEKNLWRAPREALRQYYSSGGIILVNFKNSHNLMNPPGVQKHNEYLQGIAPAFEVPTNENGYPNWHPAIYNIDPELTIVYGCDEENCFGRSAYNILIKVDQTYVERIIPEYRHLYAGIQVLAVTGSVNLVAGKSLLIGNPTTKLLTSGDMWWDGSLYLSFGEVADWGSGVFVLISGGFFSDWLLQRVQCDNLAFGQALIPWLINEQKHRLALQRGVTAP